jgi:hypothetical protein
MPTGNSKLAACGRREWVASIFAAVECSPADNGLDARAECKMKMRPHSAVELRARSTQICKLS